MSRVSPHNDRNAIKNVAYAFEFTEQLSQETVKKIIDFYKKSLALTVELPRSQPIESMTFQMGGAGAFSPSAKMLSGVTFDRLRSDGEPIWSVTFRPDAFIVICGEYESWSKTFDKVLEYVQMFSSVLDETFINVIGLEYNDEFYVEDIQDASWMDELFNKETKFLSNEVYGKKGAWHMHSGHWSDEYYDESVTNTLINTFIECSEDGQSGKHILAIKHLQKCNFAENLKLKDTVTLDKAKVIFKKSHDVNYEFIADLIKSEMKKRIRMEDFHE